MRWESEAREASDLAGAAVVDCDGITDYQGWGVLLLRRGNEWGTLAWSYGSCSGCDRYEDLDRSEVVDEFTSLIQWHPSEERAREAFAQSKGW